MFNVLLVDDHQMLRDGLRACLDTSQEYHVVGEAADGQAAIRLARELQPDFIVMDVTMPGMSGIEATREILANAQGRAKIVCLSMHADREFIAEAFAAGVVGYLLKSSAFQELLQSLQVIARGGTYLSPAVSRIVVDGLVRRPADEPAGPLASLTPREKQVLQMLAAGHNAKEIGVALHISHKTVHTFRSQLMTKIGVSNLAELTKFAIREGVATVR